MNSETNPRWRLILLLAGLGLVRPLSSIAGFYEALGLGPLAPILVTALVAALWVGIVVARRVPNPLATLAAAGALYGLLAVLLQQIIWSLFLGGAPERAPSSVPVLVLSWINIVVLNLVWGAFLGLVATGFRRLLPRRDPRRRAEA